MAARYILSLLAFLNISYAQNSLIIQNVNIIDVVGNRIIPGQTVIINNAKIEAVDASSGNENNKASVSINGKGKYLIPGLWDMHTHHNWVEDYSEIFVANGVLGTRNMFTPMEIITPLRQKIKRGEKYGPEIIAAGRLVDGPNSSIPGSYQIDSPDKARLFVDSVINDGADFLKPYDRLSRETFMALIAECKKRNFTIAGHVPTSMTVLEASDAGLKSIEHLFGVIESVADVDTFKTNPGKSWLGRVMFNKDLPSISIDEKKFSQLVYTLKKNGTWICPTLAVWNSLSNLDNEAVTKSNRLEYFPESLKEFWIDYSKNFYKSPKADWNLQRKIFEQNKILVKRLNDAEVNMIAGTDCTNPYTYVGFSLHDELENLVRAGLTEMQALQMATINAAKYLGREDETGSVSVGKSADLVLLDANPIEKISNTTKINSVIVKGKFLNRTSLDSLLNTYKKH